MTAVDVCESSLDKRVVNKAVDSVCCYFRNELPEKQFIQISYTNIEH